MTWQPSTPEPPATLVGAAKSDIPVILADVQADSQGKRTIAISQLVDALIHKGHSRPAAEWSTLECLTTSLLTQTEILESQLLPGPSRHSIQARPARVEVAAAFANDSLWGFWHSSASKSESTVENTSSLESAEACDVGVFIALKEEFRTFFEFLKPHLRPDQDAETGHQYYRFEKTASHATYRCVATFASDMGEGRASRLAERMIVKYRPTTIVVLGIAASIDKDVRLCDIVVADSVESYFENSKAVTAQDGRGFAFQLAGQATVAQQAVGAVGGSALAHSPAGRSR